MARQVIPVTMLTPTHSTRVESAGPLGLEGVACIGHIPQVMRIHSLGHYHLQCSRMLLTCLWGAT